MSHGQPPPQPSCCPVCFGRDRCICLEPCPACEHSFGLHLIDGSGKCKTCGCCCKPAVEVVLDTKGYCEECHNLHDRLMQLEEAETAERVSRYGLEQEVLALRAKVARVAALVGKLALAPDARLTASDAAELLRAALDGAEEVNRGVLR